MERNILDFLERHTEALHGLEKDVNQARWSVAKSGASDLDSDYANKKTELARLYADREAYARVRTYDMDQLSDDPLVQRQLRLMRLRSAEHQFPEDVIARLVELEIQVHRVVHTYRAVVGEEELTANQVRQRLRSSQDAEERKQVWAASKEVGRLIADDIVRLVGIRNRAARDLGYRDFYDMRLQVHEIDESSMIATVQDLLDETEESFGTAKAEIDGELAEQFSCQVSELRPWHYADPFFQEPPASRQVNLDKYYKDADIVALAVRFFEGLGFDVKPIVEASCLDRIGSKNQQAFCLPMNRDGSDVRIMAKIEQDEQSMASLLYYLGQAVYHQGIDKELPYLLRRPAHRLCAESIAIFFRKVARSPDFLIDVVGANSRSVARATNQLKNQERLSKIIFSRLAAVMVFFERAMYDNPGRDLNRLWWDLVVRIQKINRPDGRFDCPDWATKPQLATAPVYYHNYLMGEMVASQLRAAMLENGHKVVGNQGLGQFLRTKVFKSGALFTWEKTLSQATGEPLNPRFWKDDCLG